MNQLFQWKFKLKEKKQMNINILLYNNKDEVVSVDAPNNNYKNNNILTSKTIKMTIKTTKIIK